MAKQTSKQPTADLRSDQLRPHSVRLSLSLYLSLSLLPSASLCLSLRTHLPLSLSVFVGIRRMKNGHGPDSKRRECRGAHNGRIRRPSQASSAKSSPRPVSQPYGQPTKLSLSSLSHSLLLCAGSIHEVRHGRPQASNQETARRPASHLATHTSN